MKLEKLVGERFKERPSDCTVDSHALMVRGGYMKYVANGIFSLARSRSESDEIICAERTAGMNDASKIFPIMAVFLSLEKKLPSGIGTAVYI